MSFDGYEGIPPQLPSLVVSVFDDYDVTPPQLPSTVLSVLDSAGKYLFYPSIFFSQGVANCSRSNCLNIVMYYINHEGGLH